MRLLGPFTKTFPSTTCILLGRSDKLNKNRLKIMDCMTLLDF